MPHPNCHPGKWFFEVYPHPAHVVLFNREKIIKYKKGNVKLRREGLGEFQEHRAKTVCRHCESAVVA